MNIFSVEVSINIQIMSRSITVACWCILILFSCSNDDPLIEKPVGSNRAKAIYNQAYQENFEADNINDIVDNANNAYVLIDPFIDNIANSIADIKANGNEVGAYISIGTGENWRQDYNSLKPFLVKKMWGDWEGEFFVNTTNTGIIPIMKARIDQIAFWGCDWVEFDNMDWIFDDELRKEYNITATIQEGVDYHRELCNYVHFKGMKCMAKNTTKGADEYDGALYESYPDEKNWWDISGAKDFLNNGKLVIINHYNESNCNRIYKDYIALYNNDLSFICEDNKLKRYVHYND